MDELRIYTIRQAHIISGRKESTFPSYMEFTQYYMYINKKCACG